MTRGTTGVASSVPSTSMRRSCRRRRRRRRRPRRVPSLPWLLCSSFLSQTLMMKMIAMMTTTTTTTMMMMISTTMVGACISTIETILVEELDNMTPEKARSTRRTYELCPQTEYTVGFDSGGTYQFGSAPITVRSNAHVRCGSDGKSSNGCVITGEYSEAAIALVYWEQFDSDYGHHLEDVLFEGITFSNLFSANIDIMGHSGRVTFRDCIFANNLLVKNIFLMGQYRLVGQRPSCLSTTTNPDVEPLETVFEDCLFENNTSVKDFQGDPPGLTIVLAFCSYQKTVFRRCKFRNNDYTRDESGNAKETTMITVDGGQLEVIDSCFEDNLVLGGGGPMRQFYTSSPSSNSPFVPPVVRGNYGRNTSNPDPGVGCDFLHAVEVNARGRPTGTASCYEATSTTCAADVAPATPAPVILATPPPTTIAPTTIAPTTASPTSGTTTVPPATTTTTTAPPSVLRGGGGNTPPPTTATTPSSSSSSPPPSHSPSSSPAPSAMPTTAMPTEALIVPSDPTVAPTTGPTESPSFFPSFAPSVSALFFQSCFVGMTLADVDRNLLMNESEYLTFVNRQSARAFRNIDQYDGLPMILRMNFRNHTIVPLVGEGGETKEKKVSRATVIGGGGGGEVEVGSRDGGNSTNNGTTSTNNGTTSTNTNTTNNTTNNNGGGGGGGVDNIFAPTINDGVTADDNLGRMWNITGSLPSAPLDEDEESVQIEALRDMCLGTEAAIQVMADVEPTRMPTITASPSLSPLPSSIPSDSTTPTQSPAPSVNNNNNNSTGSNGTESNSTDSNSTTPSVLPSSSPSADSIPSTPTTALAALPTEAPTTSDSTPAPATTEGLVPPTEGPPTNSTTAANSTDPPTSGAKAESRWLMATTTKNASFCWLITKAMMMLTTTMAMTALFF